MEEAPPEAREGVPPPAFALRGLDGVRRISEDLFVPGPTLMLFLNGRDPGDVREALHRVETVLQASGSDGLTLLIVDLAPAWIDSEQLLALYARAPASTVVLRDPEREVAAIYGAGVNEPRAVLVDRQQKVRFLGPLGDLIRRHQAFPPRLSTKLDRGGPAPGGGSLRVCESVQRQADRSIRRSARW